VTGADTGPVQTSLTETISPPCQTSVNAPAGGTGTTITDIQACTEVVTTGGSQLVSKSTAGASIKALTVSIPGLPIVRADTVISGSQTTCAGSTGATWIGYLSIGSDVLISQPQLIAPNTHLTVGQISLNLNEQTPFTLPADRAPRPDRTGPVRSPVMAGSARAAVGRTRRARHLPGRGRASITVAVFRSVTALQLSVAQ